MSFFLIGLLAGFRFWVEKCLGAYRSHRRRPDLQEEIGRHHRLSLQDSFNFTILNVAVPMTRKLSVD